jgi:hypothetical protein
MDQTAAGLLDGKVGSLSDSVSGSIREFEEREDWARLANRIGNSPQLLRCGVGRGLLIRNGLRGVKLPEDLLLGSGLERSRRLLTRLSSQDIRLRSGGGQVGGFPLPRPKESRRAIDQGLAALRTVHWPLVDRFAAAALLALLAHPFSDGNGRLFRLVCAAGLLRGGRSAAETTGTLDALYRDGGWQLLGAVQCAAGGRHEAFWRLWQEASVRDT